MSHADHPERLDTFDALPRDRRRRILEHVASCADCRARWLAADPARMFALLGSRPVPDAVLADVSTAVLAAVDAGRQAGRDPFRGRTTWRSAAALAAGVVLGALIFTLAGRSTGDPRPRWAAAPAIEAHPTATVAVLESPGHARIVDLTVGDGQLVMIFDKDLDL